MSNKSFKSINYDNLINYDVIILDDVNNFTSEFTQAIYSFISGGGVFICFPSVNVNIKSYNKLFNKLKLNYITGIDTSKIYQK